MQLGFFAVSVALLTWTTLSQGAAINGDLFPARRNVARATAVEYFPEITEENLNLARVWVGAEWYGECGESPCTTSIGPA